MGLAAWEVFLVGALIVLSILSKAALEHFDLPDLLGYLLIGVGLRVLDNTWTLLTPRGHELLGFLAEFGVVALLFRIGLECNLEHLLQRLSGATVIWVVNVLVSLGTVLGATLVFLDWALLPSLFATVALTATGIGVSVRVWRRTDQLGSAKGALMLDVAELDDLSGVVLLALLMTLPPNCRPARRPTSSAPPF
jgi:Kef-type K+ transport system membrane component KefB